MKLVGRSAPNCFTAFRLPKDSLVTIDLLCEALDLTRSQFYRLCVDKYIKSYERDRDKLESVPNGTKGSPPIELGKEPSAHWR
jgi:hypothetical protein